MNDVATVDPRIAMQWLMADPTHEMDCFNCKGKFGKLYVKVGINLVTGFDPINLRRIIVPRVFAYFGGNHRCALAENERDILLEEATRWAEEHFRSFARRTLLEEPKEHRAIPEVIG